MRASRHLAWASMLLLGATLASGQAPIAGPVLGYLWDAQIGGIRPILGIPGSSTLGDPINIGVALRTAEIAPAQSNAIAIDEAARVLIVNTSTGELRPLDVSAAGLDRIVFSPTGASAALYYSDKRQAVVATGLPESPETRVVDLAGLPSLITAIAVSDQDGLLLLGTTEGVYVMAARQQAPALVAPATGTDAIAFLERSRDALIADRERNEIIWVRDVTGAAERVVLAGEQDGITRPIAVAATEDNRKAMAALPGAVAVMDLGGGAPVVVPCACNPSGLHRLKSASVFRLNDASTGPVFLVEAAGGEWRVVFVPGRAGTGPDAGAPATLAAPTARRRGR